MMPKVGFLLGAGASFPFGIPMMRQFYEQFIDYVRTSRAHCLPLVEKLSGEATIPDLEVLIQHLEQVRAIRPGLDILGQSAGEIVDHLALADELRGYLDMFLIETCEKFDHAKVKAKLSRFVTFAHTRDAYIFTTNYDRLIEVAATSINLPYSDGFEPASSHPESRWNGEFSRGVRLVKLHGSVNWYEEEDSQNLFRLERGYSLPSHEYRLTHGKRALRPLMIIPTLEKVMLKQPYAGLLTQFSDALKEIDIFVVIGNSLRDDHLRNTVVARSLSLNIVLVNPAACDQTSIVGHSEATHAVPLGIEEFIDIGLDPFDRLLDELSKMPADEHKLRIASFAAELAALSDESRGMTEDERAQLGILKNGPIETKLDVLRSAGQSPHLAIVAEVRALALSSGDDTVRIAAIDALVDARGADAAEVLGEIVCAATSLPVRAEAALALQTLNGGAAAEIVRRTADAVAGDRTIRMLFTKSISSTK
ncbi:MAG: SIR2 family protein [Leptospirales bacterium]